MGEVFEHKCRACGGTLNFDAKSQMVTCPYCDTVYRIEELQDKDTLSIEVNDNLNADAGEEWGADGQDMHEYICESCGGEIYCDENTSATLCPYCGNNVILKGRLSGSLKPDKIIPFKKSLDDAKSAFKLITKGKLFAPKNFVSDSKVEEIKGMYAPYWLYDAKIDADIRYKGEIESRHTVGDHEVVTRDYYAVIRKGDLAFERVPADGSSKLDDTMMESLEPFDYSEAVDFQTAYLSGFLTDKYDVPNEEAAPRAVERMRNSTERMFYETVTGYTSVSVVSSNISITDSSSNYVLYPVWLLTTKFQDKVHHFAMNGQTGKMVGNIPRDNKKAAAWTVCTLVLAFAITFGIAGAIMGKFDGLCLGIGAVVGLIVALIIFFGFSHQLKGIRPQDYAANYYVPGSMELEVEEDYHLYRTTHTHKINNN